MERRADGGPRRSGNRSVVLLLRRDRRPWGRRLPGVGRGAIGRPGLSAAGGRADPVHPAAGCAVSAMGPRRASPPGGHTSADGRDDAQTPRPVRAGWPSTLDRAFVLLLPLAPRVAPRRGQRATRLLQATLHLRQARLQNLFIRLRLRAHGTSEHACDRPSYRPRRAHPSGEAPSLRRRSYRQRSVMCLARSTTLSTATRATAGPRVLMEGLTAPPTLGRPMSASSCPLPSRSRVTLSTCGR